LKKLALIILLAVGVLQVFLFPVDLGFSLPLNLDNTLFGVIIVACVILVYYQLSNDNHRMLRIISENERLKTLRRDESVDTRIFEEVKKIHQRFSETHDEEDVVYLTADVIRRLLNVPYSVLKIVGDSEDATFLMVESGDKGLDLGHNLIVETIKQEKSRLLNHLRLEEGYEIIYQKGYNSLLACPLFKFDREGHKRSYGLICVLARDEHAFTTIDLETLKLFADETCLIIENATLYRKTQEMAIRDGLTNLFNHSHFKQTLNAEMKSALEGETDLSLIMGDIDFFKAYNDTNGHPQGDECLRKVSRIILGATRGSDLPARYGGEEFILILPRTDEKGAMKVAEEIRSGIEKEPFFNQHKQPNGNLTITFGAATCPQDAQTADELINAADKALYYGKSGPRNVVNAYSSVKGLSMKAASQTEPPTHF